MYQINPPTLVPLVEVVPAPYTLDIIISGAVRMLSEIGQVPVTMRKELPGFVVNRLQYALLNECWRLAQVHAHMVLRISLVFILQQKSPPSCHFLHKGYIDHRRTVTHTLTTFSFPLHSTCFCGDSLRDFTILTLDQLL